MPGDLVRIASREDPHVRSTGGVTDEDIRPGHAGTLEQGVQVGREGDPVLRAGYLVAASVASAVVGTDGGRRRERSGRCLPRRRTICAEARLEDDDGTARARAFDVEPVAADVDQLAGCEEPRCDRWPH